MRSSVRSMGTLRSCAPRAFGASRRTSASRIASFQIGEDAAYGKLRVPSLEVPFTFGDGAQRRTKRAGGEGENRGPRTFRIIDLRARRAHPSGRRYRIEESAPVGEAC